LTESWKKDCKCYGSFSESDLKRIEETASCAISIHSSFLTIRDEGSPWCFDRCFDSVGASINMVRSFKTTDGVRSTSAILTRTLGTLGGNAMAEVKIEIPFTVEIPSNLGLSEVQQKQLAEKFRNQLIETISGKQADVIPTAKVEVVARVKNQVV